MALRQLSLVEEKLQRFLHMGGEDQPCFRPCCLVALLDEAVALFAPQCRHTHVDLRWQPPAESPTIMGDSSQLGNLFVNVLGNAVEAAGAGGCVEVRTRVCREPPHRKNSQEPRPCESYAIVEVIDSGSGPPGEIACQLFEEFVTSKPEGVGLGLAVARQVAEAHGGSIGWCREHGQTCFQIRLPIVSNQTPATATP